MWKVQVQKNFVLTIQNLGLGLFFLALNFHTCL